MTAGGVPDDFLSRSAAEYSAPFVRALADSMAPPADARIGAWRLLHELGHGGMGTVYLAERADQAYTQRVALKVVRGSLTLDDQLITRFREERQILAALDHPGIARLFDGGVTPEGLPWYAMEHIDGIAIDRHAREASLTIQQRLVLFIEVCAAVAYAHRLLVVHRDLKPSNLLVTADGRPKLVDFGVARFLTEAATPPIGQPLATRGYASPEQLRGDPIAVTDDIYSLGVILQELLTGRRRASTSDTRNPLEALDRDLQAIIGAALAPLAADRYPSVEMLRDEIMRHLRREPVAVRSGERLYRWRRFVSRNRLGVAAATVVAVSLAAGLSIAMAQASRADRERDAARVAAINATQVSEFLTRVLYLADPNTTLGTTVTVAAAIDSASRWLGRDLAASPEAQAEIALVLAHLYGSTGNISMHLMMADSALAMAERVWGPDHPRLASVLGAVAEARRNAGDLATSEPMLRRMVALAERDTALQPFRLVHAKNMLAISLRDQDRLIEAEAVLREILAGRSELDTVYPVGLDHALTGLGHVQLADERPMEAAASYREVLERRKLLWGDSHPEVANALVNLAGALGRAGRFEESIALYGDGLAMRHATQGDDHPEIGVDLVGLGDTYRLAGDTAGATRTYREALARLRRTHGPTHPLTMEVMGRINE